MLFSEYLADLPLLHTWDDGETWNTGGFRGPHLKAIHEAASRGGAPRICETGAGNSTLTFLQVPDATVVTIAPDGALYERIVRWCDDHGVDRSRLDFRRARSEVALPTIALAETQQFDVALIDGLHGWPNVFVDFCYLNAMLASGGLLLIDDLQIHSVAELGRLLEAQPGFELVHEIGKLQFWEKQTDDRWLPGHNREPYIVQRSKRP